MTTCTHLVDSGAYVLGALSPPQRLTFERHMATCADCRAEVNELAVLPGLLGRIDEPAVLAAGELPPPTVLPGVLAKVHRQRRGRRVLAFAAGLAVACLALVAGLNMPSSTPNPSRPVVAASARPTPVLEQMQPISGAEPVSAEISLTQVDGGTKVWMRCKYPTNAGTTWEPAHGFTLFVVPRTGEAQQLDAWGAHPGQDITAIGMTGWTLSQIDRIELRSASGHPLLVYNVPA